MPYLLLAGILASIALAQINQRLASPLLAIADRWLRWGVFSLGAARVCSDYQLVDRPFWVLTILAFALWFLGETLYHWIAISALSASSLPLFPRYVANQR